MMAEWVSLALQLAAMSLLAAAAEHLLPKGKLKSVAMTAIGIQYVAALVAKVVGIFDRMGV